MKRYYLLASLPPLSFVSSEAPAISIQKFWLIIQEEAENLIELMQSILLEQDIVNIEKTLSGPLEPLLIQGTIPEEKIQKAQSDAKILKQYFPTEIFDKISMEKWQSSIWLQYFDYQKDIATKYKSCLKDWLIWNQGLRMYIAQMRAEALGTSLAQNSMIKTVETSGYDYQTIYAEYRKQNNPMEAELYLDSERFKFLNTIAIPYSFSDDEIVVYALKLLILERWWAISQTRIDIFEKVVND